MATMVGPWIAPTIILLSSTILSLIPNKKVDTRSLFLIQAIGAGGGIVATGIGFALPMLYFLNPRTFWIWLSNPLYFCFILAMLCFTAGWLGLYLGKKLHTPFLKEQKLPFPVSNLLYQIITSQTQPQQSNKMLKGMLSTIILCFLRDGIGPIKGFFSKTFYLFPSFFRKELAFSIWPMIWALGYNIGPTLVGPLCIGIISKYFILIPLANHASKIPFNLIPSLSTEAITFAFCGGIMIFELLYEGKRLMLRLIKSRKTWLKPLIKQFQNTSSYVHTTQSKHNPISQTGFSLLFLWLEPTLIICASAFLLSHFNFGAISQLCLILLTGATTYFICKIGGEVGFIPFGRFSTLIVITLLLCFTLDTVQATISCIFFNICAATASDLLFDYKTGALCKIDKQTTYRYQWIGLIVVAIVTGGIFWLLFTNLPLGTEALFAQRGKTKAIIIQSLNFDLSILSIGFLFGWILKKCKIHSGLVFSGLIMPNDISIGLLIGGLCAFLSRKKRIFNPFSAGIFTAESLWITITLLIRAI